MQKRRWSMCAPLPVQRAECSVTRPTGASRTATDRCGDGGIVARVDEPTQAEWAATIPRLLADAAAAWSLTVGDPYPDGAAGHVVRVECADGTPAVLKLGYPHRESEHEADALVVWDGDGAVRLLQRNEVGTVLLLERCEPGTFSLRPVQR